MRKETELQKLKRQRREANARYEARHKVARARKKRARRKAEKKPAPPPTGWSECVRLSGIVESVCPCGVGHPNVEKTKALRKSRGVRPLWRECDGIHGCGCGHCSADAPVAS
jgi:hypothetical protein